ncbi:MAG TPA: 50S ribosomal protein L29 [Candidatus Polarisedimenticolia bacterium]|jgi:large subunit ribosomal protein L29|nr:50S ribosomal protein L29 [Candidatus Polarisedimenticolia bacterium]
MARPVEKFREMNANELEIQQRELAEQIFRLRFQLSTGQAEGLKKLREAKRDLARVKTLLRETELRKA